MKMIKTFLAGIVLAFITPAIAQTITAAQQSWINSVKSPMSNNMRLRGEATVDTCSAPNRTRWELPDSDVRDVQFFPGDIEVKTHNGGWYRVPSQAIVPLAENPLSTAQVWYEVTGDPRRALLKIVCYAAKP
jgi:hypothetical protein